jgi:cytosine/adenosine deaminase-related metal-dependent hydrolase
MGSMKRAILYRARYLLPIAAEPLEDGALLVEGGRIAAAGRFSALRRADAGIVDCGDAILLPPLANAHTHLELTDFPRWAAELGETAPPAGFVDWMLRAIRVKRAVASELLHPSLERGIAESLKAGTGAVGDILAAFAARSAYSESPLRGRLFYETLGRDPTRTTPQLEAIAALLAEGPAGRLAPGLSPHSPYTLSAGHLEAALALAARHEAPLSIHAAESSAEVAFLADAAGPIAEQLYPFVGWGGEAPPPAGLSPVEYLAGRGALRRGTLLVHGVQVSPADVEQVAAAGCTVVLCPRSNARLGVGTAPVGLYRRAGVSLALGTDSLASNDSLSLWDELAAARQLYGNVFASEELLALATAGGAAALGLEGEMGAFIEGWGAHFQVLRPAALPSRHELAEFLCAPGRTAEVAALYLDGRDVLQKG